jgi:hypothetical protein
MGSEVIVPFIINLGTRWKYVVSVTLRPLYSRHFTVKMEAA